MDSRRAATRCTTGSSAELGSSYELQVSVLADTSYNSLSVDEVAAQHAQADCVVRLLAASSAYAGCLALCNSYLVTLPEAPDLP